MPTTQTIYVGNGYAVTTYKEGSFKITKNVTVNNVLRCSILEVNLISVSKLIEKGCNVFFENDSCNVWKGKNLLFTALKVHGLYKLHNEQEKVFSTLGSYRKLAHFGKMTKL